MPDYGWGQIPQAMANVTGNALNMAQMQQHAGVLREQEIAARQANQLGAINLQRAMEQDKRDNEVIPVSEHPAFKSLPVEAQNNVIQSFSKGGYGEYQNGMLIGSRKNIARYLQDVSTNTDALEQTLVKPMVNQANAGYQKAFQDYQKIQEKFNAGQATQQEMDQAKGAADTAYGQLASTLNRGQVALAKSQMSKVLMDLQSSGQFQKLPADVQITINAAYEIGDTKTFSATLEQQAAIQAKKAEYVKLGQGETLINPATNEVIAKGAPKDVNLQMVGHTPDGKPVNFNPVTGKQEVEGKEYTGVVKPRVEVQSFYSIQQTPNGLVAVNNRDPSKMINLGITKPITVAQQDAIEAVLNLQDSLKQVKSNYDKSFVGPVQGRVGGAAGATGIGTTPKEQQFRAQTAELNRILYALSGKQINEQEMKRLEPFLPNVNDSDVKFTSKMIEFERNLAVMLKNKIQVAKSSGGGTNVASTESTAPSYSKEDLEFTARKYGMTVEQVKAKLGVK